MIHCPILSNLQGLIVRKFVVAFDEKVFRELDKDAKSRNISLQAFLRAVVIPEWIRNGNIVMAGRPTVHRLGRGKTGMGIVPAGRKLFSV